MRLKPRKISATLTLPSIISPSIGLKNVFNSSEFFRWPLWPDLAVQRCHLAINAVQDIRRTEADWGTHLIKDTASADLQTQQKFLWSICSQSEPHTEVDGKTDSHSYKHTGGSYTYTSSLEALTLTACASHVLPIPLHTPLPEFWCVTFYPMRKTILLMRSGNRELRM